MTTQDNGLEDRGPQPSLLRDNPALPETRDDEGTTVPRFREPLEVPVVYADIQPLTWKSEEHVAQILRCVTVMANIAVPETVSVALAPFQDDGSAATAADLGMVFFDLKPVDALALADELRLAAEEAVVPCRCGRTLATIGDYSDTCLHDGQRAT